MSEASACPKPEELERLVHGDIRPPDDESLANHVVACTSCLNTLHGMKDGDTLIQKLCANKQLDPKVESMMNTLVQDGKSPPAPPPAKHDFRTEHLLSRFLEPAQSALELGSFKHYRVTKLLGAGGRGLVYKADDTHLQRPVAVKVLQPDMIEDEEARERFLREARGMAAIRHDNVTNVFDVDEHNGIPYFVMEYLDGETLDNRLERGGRLELDEAIRIGREVAEGLNAAHERNFIHRDIKPANIWLERDTGRVKILDFGLARQTGAGASKGLTATGTIMGTPNYMAPEQARGDAVDARCDLFSLGCLLYQMCSGVLPFDGPSTMAVLTALAIETPEPLDKLNPSLPAPFIDLVDQLLEKKREHRPDSARVVADALKGLESGTMVLPPRRKKAGSSKLSSRRLALAGVGGLAAALALFLLLRGGQDGPPSGPTPPKGKPIKVGLLYSLSGNMADSESVVVRASRLAFEDINANGGLLGRPIEVISADGESDEAVFARQARKLIEQDKVCTIFGCWTSASRKAVKPIVEGHDNLLVYAVQFEGLEESPNIIYNGSVPNQQILPAIRYFATKLDKKRFFLVGSDYVFPRVANTLIRDEAAKQGVTIVGEEYLLLGSFDVKDVIDKIKAAKPDLIVNTINGETNRPFFRALREAGITPDKTPTVSFSVSEHELRSLAVKDMIGDYAAWNYFQSLPGAQNEQFIKKVKDKFGPESVTTDPMVTAYFGIMLWAQAVEKAKSTDSHAIRKAIKGEELESPEGPVRIDPPTQHTWQIFRLGQVTVGGQFKEVFNSKKPIEPVPFPNYRKRVQWDAYLTKLYDGWGGRWSAPDEKK